MPFISENELERALVAAAKNPAAAPEFYRLLLESDLMALGSIRSQKDAGQAQVVLNQGDLVDLVFGSDQGWEFLPVFSSLPRMQAYVTVDSPCITLKGRDLLDMTRGMPVILNPNSDYGKKLTPAQVGELLDGRAPPAGTAAPKTVVAEADYPVALVNGLTGLFRVRPEVTTAWMIQVTFADRANTPHPLVGVELAPGGDMAKLVEAVQAMAQHSVPDMVFDVRRVDRDNPQGMTEALLQVPPFYQRGRAETPAGPLN